MMFLSYMVVVNEIFKVWEFLGVLNVLDWYINLVYEILNWLRNNKKFKFYLCYIKKNKYSKMCDEFK